MRGDFIGAIAEDNHGSLQPRLCETFERMRQQRSARHHAQGLERRRRSQSAALPGGEQNPGRDHVTN